MTSKIRRRILVCVVALAITLPVESILVQAIAEPDSQAAAEQWVDGLTAKEVDQAASTIQDYPFRYRKEIMKRLSPAARADVWRSHLGTYLETHPNLDDSAGTAIEAAMGLATPSAFAGAPTSDLREQTGIIAEQIASILGRDEAEFLMYRLGPKDGTFASAEPLSHKLTNYVRGLVVALAAVGDDCDCNLGFGCDGYYTECKDGNGCTPDTEWPACGWWWNETCDGMCRAGAGA